MGLIAAETNGTSQETEALYREHGTAVAALCHSLLRDRGEAEDAAQQVFLSAHRALLNGAALREPLAWLLTVARNECYARFRQRAVTPVPSADAPEGAAADASVQVIRAGELASVWDEVGQMPATQREAFLLREIQGLSYGQLADELSISTPSVRSLLLRARMRLRRRLRDVALGGVPWLQGLLRLVSGEGGSPLPAATKAAAVGLGALALVGGGDVPRPAHLATPAPRHATARHLSAARVRHVSSRADVVAVPSENRSLRTGHSLTTRRAPTRDDGSSGRDGRRSGVVSASGSDDGSGGATSTEVSNPTDGRGGGSSGPDGSHDGSSTTKTSGGSGTGSDDGSTSTTTVTTTTPDGSGSSGGSSGPGDGGLDGGGTSGGSDGGTPSTYGG